LYTGAWNRSFRYCPKALYRLVACFLGNDAVFIEVMPYYTREGGKNPLRKCGISCRSSQ
jgi:hypothetical protein